jgi:hypothetical protein
MHLETKEKFGQLKWSWFLRSRKQYKKVRTQGFHIDVNIYDLLGSLQRAVPASIIRANDYVGCNLTGTQPKYCTAQQRPTIIYAGCFSNTRHHVKGVFCAQEKRKKSTYIEVFGGFIFDLWSILEGEEKIKCKRLYTKAFIYICPIPTLQITVLT